MLAVGRDDVGRAAEFLAIAVAKATDSAGLRIIVGPQDQKRYWDAIMGAICQLLGGDAVGLRGDVHLGPLDRNPFESLHLKDLDDAK